MKNSQLTRFFGRTAILLLILFAADRLLGSALEYLFYKQNHGDNYVSIYLLEKAKDDILVLGGSRASHHFNASLLEDSTGMTCFNGGRDDMNIYYSSAVLPIAYERAIPKVVILDILPMELSKSNSNKSVLERIASVLMPFSHRHPQLLNTIAQAGDYNTLKMKISHIYPYNSTIGASIQNGFTSFGHISIKGYEPLKGTIDSQTYKKSIWGDFAANDSPPDSASVSAFKKLAELLKSHQTRFITIISPFYFPSDFYNNPSYLCLKQLVKENQLELYDFSHDPRFLKNPSLFYDDIHLNDSGAKLFSASIARIINEKKQGDIIQN